MQSSEILFQYITCYSLSDVGEDGDSRLPGFNTSHVTLYQDMVGVGILIPEFQYITCYSLSLNPIRISFPSLLSFNTSHVTLYPSFYRDFIHPHV